MDFNIYIYIYVGDPKIPGIAKKSYLKYSYKFETLVSFEVLLLRLDAAIPTPLPVLGLLHPIAGGSTSKETKVSNLYKYFK